MSDNTSKKSEAKKHKKRKKQKKHPKLRLALKLIFLLVLLGAVALAVLFYMKYGDDISGAYQSAVETVENSSVETFRANQTSLVFDDKEKQIAVLKGEKDVYYVTLDYVPQAAKDAFIVTEDKKFYSHRGIDIKGITAAAVELVKNRGRITRGGSTITQQVAKLVFLTNARTFSRKINEIFISLELEKKYSKDEILEFYLNNIYFANGYYGIEAASKGYFSKSCNELSLSQLIFLCAIPNSPTRYDPIENFDNTIERRNRILDQMLAAGKITDEEYSDAHSEEITLKIPEKPKRNAIETYAMNCTVKALMKVQGFVFKNYFKSEEEQNEYNEQYSDMYSDCQQLLFRSGYRVYTSLNMKKQKKLQKAIDEQLKEDKEKGEDGIYEFQGAGVCISNKTGKVVAISGGRKQNITGYTFNRAFQSYRQPGSSIKPILVYAPAFEREYTLTSVVRDEPVKDGPKNSNGRYMGGITLRTAIEQSVNTVAWKLFNELSPKVGLNYLLRMNFSKITKEDYTLSSSLGGLTNGASTVEMASAYAALENKGVFREPTCIVKITDAQGNVIVDKKDFEKKRVYKEEAAKITTEGLMGVLTRGTGRGYALTDMPCAGKTGTTNDKKDGWFAGYTPYYTTVIWVGNDIPRSRDDLLGNTYPLKIWYDYMTQIHENLESKQFPGFEETGNNYNSYHNSYSSQRKDYSNNESDEDSATAAPDSDSDNAESDSNEPAAPADDGQNSQDNQTSVTVPDPGNTNPGSSSDTGSQANPGNTSQGDSGNQNSSGDSGSSGNSNQPGQGSQGSGQDGSGNQGQGSQSSGKNPGDGGQSSSDGQMAPSGDGSSESDGDI